MANCQRLLDTLENLKIIALVALEHVRANRDEFVNNATKAQIDKYEKMIIDFSRHLGVAFQILNDLKDWDGDSDNKMVAGQDVLSARPTLLLALALEGSAPAERVELLSLIDQCQGEAAQMGKPRHTPEDIHVESGKMIDRVRRIFLQADVFDKAEKLVEKYRARAEAIADEVEPTELRELLYFMVDTILDRQPSPPAEPDALPLVQLSI